MKYLLIPIWIMTVLFFFSSCQKSATDAAKDTKDKSSAIEVYWTCSMHPQVHKDGPGKCDICGMDLIKAPNKPAQTSDTTHYPPGHGALVLDQQKQDMIGVKWGVVEKKELFKSIDTAGRVAFDPELYAAQNEYIEALKQEESVRKSPLEDVKHSAQAMADSSRLRLKILGLSDAQISALRDSSKVNASILIPKSGDRLWIYAEVYEMDLNYVRPGLRAKISGQALNGAMMEAEVVSVDRVINPTTRTAKVRIALKNAPLDLRPESYVDVSIESPLGLQTVIPFDAVLDTGKQTWAFVESKGSIEPRKIIIKSYANDEVAVERGLVAGEKIVTSANFLIDSESRLVGVREDQNKKTPVCPEGKKWHQEMNHCME
jgi:membrane fusion protein, copper/silver efflux system